MEKGFDAIIFDHNVTNKFFSGDSNYIVDIVMWPKFENSMFLWENFSRPQFSLFNQKNHFFEERLQLVIGMASKFNGSVAKGLKSRVRKFLGSICMFAEVTRKNLVVGLFGTPLLNKPKNVNSASRETL